MRFFAKLTGFIFLGASFARGATFPNPPAYLMQYVNFVIIHATDGTGKITSDQITQQLAALNAAFSGKNAAQHGYPHPVDSQIRFALAQNPVYVQDDNLFNNCPTGSATQLDTMHSRYSLSPKTVYNVYVCNLGQIGVTNVPGRILDDYFNPIPQDDPRYAAAGTVINYRTFAGGDYVIPNKNPQQAINLTLGNVLVHEVGHYYGLWHPYDNQCGKKPPFDPNNTSMPYEVPDLPPMRGNIFGGCNQNRAPSCPGAGKPDLANYMLSTNDNCRTHFTRDQVQYMQEYLQVWSSQWFARCVIDPTTSPQGECWKK